jgi:hypothetical protein
MEALNAKALDFRNNAVTLKSSELTGAEEDGNTTEALNGDEHLNQELCNRLTVAVGL